MKPNKFRSEKRRKEIEKKKKKEEKQKKKAERQGNGIEEGVTADVSAEETDTVTPVEEGEVASTDGE